MIKKMTKYSFVVFHREVEDFLKKLQETGVVDITRQKRAIDSYSMDKFEEIAQCNAAAGALKRLKAEALKNKVVIPAEKPQTGNLLALYTESAAQKESLKAKLAALKSELADALPWGAFKQEDLQNLEKLGLSESEGRKLIDELTSEMLKAAEALEFERAADLRDQIKALKKEK